MDRMTRGDLLGKASRGFGPSKYVGFAKRPSLENEMTYPCFPFPLNIMLLRSFGEPISIIHEFSTVAFHFEFLGRFTSSAFGSSRCDSIKATGQRIEDRRRPREGLERKTSTCDCALGCVAVTNKSLPALPQVHSSHFKTRSVYLQLKVSSFISRMVASSRLQPY